MTPFIKRMTLAVGILAVLPAETSIAVEDGHHPHHIAISGGAARHNDENSGYLGVDYTYRFKNDYLVGAFAEEVSGDFNIRAFGLIFGRYFGDGWKVGTGPGVETKLKNNKNLFLWHVSGGYDWHHGNWSFGPVVAYDFIEDASNTVYVGLSVGHGF